MPTVRGAEGADPASVAFEAVKAGIEQEVDVVLIDTAGRLHTKTGLMDELGKVKRVIERQAPVGEVLLVLDATTGQNGLDPGADLRRGGRRDGDRADQARRLGQGWHRGAGAAGARRTGEVGRDSARERMIWRRSTPRPSSTRSSSRRSSRVT